MPKWTGEVKKKYLASRGPRRQMTVVYTVAITVDYDGIATPMQIQNMVNHADFMLGRTRPNYRYDSINPEVVDESIENIDFSA